MCWSRASLGASPFTYHGEAKKPGLHGLFAGPCSGSIPGKKQAQMQEAGLSQLIVAASWTSFLWSDLCIADPVACATVFLRRAALMVVEGKIPQLRRLVELAKKRRCVAKPKTQQAVNGFIGCDHRIVTPSSSLCAATHATMKCRRETDHHRPATRSPA